MKIWHISVLLLLVLIGGGVLVGLAVLKFAFAPSDHADEEVRQAAREVAAWEIEDASRLWQEVSAMWYGTEDVNSSGRIHTNIPALLKGYKLHRTPYGIEGLRGGSSFGLTGATIRFTFEPTEAETEGISFRSPFISASYSAKSGEWITQGAPPEERR